MMAATKTSWADPFSMQRKATLIGTTAILQWSSLALLTTRTAGIPPLQLTAMGFLVGAILGVGIWFRNGFHPRRLASLTLADWLVGIYGLFGYHLFYFLALKNAPVMEANLINYLWPLMMVLFSAFLPGERLKPHHLLGSLLGFAGAALLITGGGSLELDPAHLPGFLSALGCAVVWSSYSVLTRRLGDVPTEAVAAFCVVTAFLSAAAHLLTEQTVMPTGGQWPVIVLLGIFPIGLAFYVWDHGVKKGNIRTLGAMAYFAPFFSTVLLIAGGGQVVTWQVGAACALITSGALVAAGLVPGIRSPLKPPPSD
jgi:drug/metabolite transporter (DMT)-like permease